MRILVLFAGDALKARSVAERRPLKGSLRQVLAGGVTVVTTTMTYLSLAAAQAEGPTILLLELAQVPGQPSPHGISKTLN